MEYKTSTELELLQGYFTEFNGMLSDIAEDVDIDALRNTDAFNRVLSDMRKLCSEFSRYAKEEHSADYTQKSVDYAPEDARIYVTPQGGEVEAYIDPTTGRRIGIDAKGREWGYTPEPGEIEEERYTETPTETPVEEEASFRLGTMFSGIGAIEQALEQFNLPHVIDFAADNDKDVKTSYLANYSPLTWYDDVKDIDGTKYRGLDLLVGGSPCQSFSIASNNAKGFNDTRGTLFYEFVRVLKEAQPRYFIYENVSNVLKHDSGKTWEVMRAAFNEVNYNFDHKVLNAKDYNCPQNRRRIFVVGIRKGITQSFTYPAPLPLTTKVSDYFESPVPKTEYEYARLSAKTIQGALFNAGHKVLTAKPYGSHTLNAEIACCFIARMYAAGTGNYYTDFTPPTPTEPGNHRFNIAYLQGLGVTDFNFMQGHTSARLRTLSSRELLRVQGFSDSFKIAGSFYKISKQVGNSISVQVLKEVCKQLLPELGSIQAPAPMSTQLELLPSPTETPTETPVEEEASFRLGTMFSGIGAIEQALEQFNLPHVIDFAADNDKDVKTSYLANYSPLTWYDDVKDIDGTKYRGLDLLVGGSPCQSFSNASPNPKGFNDTRGTLFYEFVRVLKEAQPRYFIYENVSNVLKHDKGKTWAVMRAAFNEVNYNFSYQVLNAKDYNCPQNRRRIFVVGIRKGITQSFTYPAPLPLTTKVSDYLESSVTQTNNNTIAHYSTENRVLRILKKTNMADLPNLGYIYGGVGVNRELALCFIKCSYESQCGNYYTDFTPYQTGESGFRFDIAYLQRLGVTDFNFMQGHTSARLRSLSSRELLRVQGFSDSFKIAGGFYKIAAQVGNSISVQVLKALCKQLLPELGSISVPAPMSTQLELLPSPTETPVIEEEASVLSASVVPSAIGGTMLDNYTWYKDEKINGDARDIFTWILKADPRTCSPEEFIEGLLYARLDKAGKAASLTQRELVDLVLLRSFAGYPTTVKGVTDKVRAISKQLKASKDFTKKGLEDMTKRGYPTASFYTQAHITAVEAARAPCSLSGDDLDEICELLAEPPVVEPPVVEPPVVEEETPTIDVPDAVARALALLGL